MRRNAAVLAIVVALVLGAVWWLWPAPRQPTDPGSQDPVAAQPVPDDVITPTRTEQPVPDEPSEALARCTFERDLLAGQVSRCGGLEVPWPAGSDPQGIEALIRSQTPEALDLELYCEEFPCIAVFSTTSDDYSSVLDAAFEAIEGLKWHGYSTDTSRDRLQVVMPVFRGERLDEATRARAKFREKRHRQGLEIPGIVPPDPTLPALERCNHEREELTLVLDACEGRATTWDPAAIPDGIAGLEASWADRVAEAAGDDVDVRVNCDEPPCIATLLNVDMSAASTIQTELGVKGGSGVAANAHGEASIIVLEDREDAGSQERAARTSERMMRLITEARAELGP